MLHRTRKLELKEVCGRGSGLHRINRKRGVSKGKRDDYYSYK